jgi:hypothetical protein
MAENNELNDDELVDYDDEGEALEGVGNVAAAGDVKKCAHAGVRARARDKEGGACSRIARRRGFGRSRAAERAWAAAAEYGRSSDTRATLDPAGRLASSRATRRAPARQSAQGARVRERAAALASARASRAG